MDNLLTRIEAAKRSRISVGTLDSILKGGNGPKVTRVGKKIFIREDHLSQWIDSLSN